MSEIATELPTAIEALHALLQSVCAERDTAIAERDQALSRLDRLRHLLRQLQRAQFGRRSEKLDPDQLHLALEDIEQAIAAEEAEHDKKDAAAASMRAAKRRINRGALPLHLPRVDVTIEPDDTNCPCCCAPMHVIGEERSERLDVIPAQFRVIVTHRPKYACRACEEAVVQAPAPERLIKSGLPIEAMVAYVLVANTHGICRSIGKPRCCSFKASASSARSWRSGWAMRRPSSSRFIFACANSFSRRARSRSMKP